MTTHISFNNCKELGCKKCVSITNNIYCEQHGCNVDGCCWKKCKLSNYCTKHKCAIRHCMNVRNNNSKCCVQHICQYPGRNKLYIDGMCNKHEKCLLSECNNYAWKNHYCDNHERKELLCHELCMHKFNVCTKHKCYVMNCNNSHIFKNNLCHAHTCEKWVSIFMVLCYKYKIPVYLLLDIKHLCEL